jgi:hypothetical protein
MHAHVCVSLQAVATILAKFSIVAAGLLDIFGTPPPGLHIPQNVLETTQKASNLLPKNHSYWNIVVSLSFDIA